MRWIYERDDIDTHPAHTPFDVGAGCAPKSGKIPLDLKLNSIIK